MRAAPFSPDRTQTTVCAHSSSAPRSHLLNTVVVRTRPPTERATDPAICSLQTQRRTPSHVRGRSEENVAWARSTHPPTSVQRCESARVPTHRALPADVWPSTCRSSPGQQAAEGRNWLIDRGSGRIGEVRRHPAAGRDGALASACGSGAQSHVSDRVDGDGPRCGAVRLPA